MHPNDRRRVVRALELAEAGASLAPDADTGSGRRTPATRRSIFGLEVPRENLDRRIEERTRSMVERGVEDEVAPGARRARSRPLPGR